MKFYLTVIFAILALFQSRADSHWQIKDGTGSLKVKDSGSNQLHGEIIDSSHCTWSREDDRGFFLNFNAGGAVKVKKSLKLMLEQGFVIDVHFACNIEAIGKSGFASLLCKGVKRDQGYSLMIGKKGELAVYFRNISPGFKVLPLALKSNVEYKLHISVGDHKVKVILNGKQVAEYSFKGRLAILNQPLFIGSIPEFPFSGNIYDVKIKAYGEKIDKKQNAVLDFKPRPIVDPEGTVMISDGFKFSPQGAVVLGKRPGINHWRVRKVNFFHNCHTMIYPPSDINSYEITYDPKLKGKYDVYLAVRCRASADRIQMKIGDQPDYYTINTVSVGPKHRNAEVLVARDVEMEGVKFTLASAGLIYAGYIKLIPSANRRENEILDPAVSVTRGPRITQDEVDDFFLKRIEKNLKNGFFIERTYVEEKKAAAPSAVSKKRGYQLFERNWMDLLFPVNVPEKDTGKIQLKTAAAQGEFEPVTFGVRGLCDISQLTLKQKGEFKDNNGKTAPVKVEIGVVEALVKRTTNYTGRSEVMTAPQYIERSDSIALKNGESRQFWITLKPGIDAHAGVYRATFELTDGKSIAEIPVELEVYPFKLDKLRKMDVGMFHDNDDYSAEEVDSTVRDMADHGCTTLYCHAGSTLAFTGDTPETFAVDWGKSTLPFYMASFRKYSMSGRVHFMLDGAYNVVNNRFPKQWREVYTRILKEIESKRKSDNWPEFVYWGFDEVLSRAKLIPDFIRDIKLQKELGFTTGADHIWYKTSRPYQKSCDVIAPLVDVFALRFNTKNFWYVDTWKQIMQSCQELGKELIPYNSNNAITFAQPAAARYSFGWFARTAGKGIAGHLIYVYRLIYNNPYNDLDGPATDWIYQYPPFGARKGGPSLDWESYREGVDDLRYIETLENLIAEAEKKNIDVSEAKQLLVSLIGSFDMQKFYKESRFVDPKWDKTWQDKSGRRFASGRFNVPNGWTLENYDIARRQIADEIIKLKPLLNKK